MIVALGLMGCQGEIPEEGIGPEGGTVTLGDVRLVIPEGAVADRTTFRIVDSGAPPELPWEGLTNVFTFEPEGFVFDRPVRLEVAYDPVDVDARLWVAAQGGFTQAPSAGSPGLLTAELDVLTPGFVGPPTLRVDTPAPYPPTDILLVVERSPRTKDARAALGEQAGPLLDLLAWDVRIGVTTMNGEAPDFGRLREVDGVRFLDGSTPDPEGTLAGMLDAAVPGEPMGRGAAYAVIADPLPEDADFRRDGRLELLFVSRREDLSTNNPVSRSEFVEWLRLQGPSAGDAAAHGAYHIPGTVCPGASYPAGVAYNAYVNQTDGEKASICAPAWDPFLTEIAARTLDSARVVLPGPASAPPSVALRDPDGVERPLDASAFTWDAATATVRFDQGVRPALNEVVVVRWLP